ncbi:hypothetical protein KSP40_PGU001456 [Platanthera guangdongensis]|uniref:Uncharacterized protein n=1 Tax=Platanthera guangdongensis TaxID=2320717 RepID=A0ABR2LM49_9ASPA
MNLGNIRVVDDRNNPRKLSTVMTKRSLRQTLICFPSFACMNNAATRTRSSHIRPKQFYLINWRHDRDCGNQVALQAGPDLGINSVGLVAPDNQNISHSLCKLEEEIDGKHASPVEDCDKGKHDLTQTQVCESLQGKQQFKDAKFMVAISPKRTNLEGDGDLVRYLSAKIPEVCEEDKCESDCVRSSVEVGTHNMLPYPIVTGSGFTNYDFDPFTKVKKVDEMLHDESRSITTVDSCNNYSGECQTAYDRMGGRIWKNNQLLIPHVEKHHCLPIDVVGNVKATGSPAEQPDQNSRGMIIGGDGKKLSRCYYMTTALRA